MTDKIIPFDPNISKEEVDRLFRKLADTRLPQVPIVPDAGDDYGTPSLSTTRLLHQTINLTSSRPVSRLDQHTIQPLAEQVLLGSSTSADLCVETLHYGNRRLASTLHT